jgi:hypothetical protein
MAEILKACDPTGAFTKFVHGAYLRNENCQTDIPQHLWITSEQFNDNQKGGIVLLCLFEFAFPHKTGKLFYNRPDKTSTSMVNKVVFPAGFDETLWESEVLFENTKRLYPNLCLYVASYKPAPDWWTGLQLKFSSPDIHFDWEYLQKLGPTWRQIFIEEPKS